MPSPLVFHAGPLIPAETHQRTLLYCSTNSKSKVNVHKALQHKPSTCVNWTDSQSFVTYETLLQKAPTCLVTTGLSTSCKKMPCGHCPCHTAAARWESDASLFSLYLHPGRVRRSTKRSIINIRGCTQSKNSRSYQMILKSPIFKNICNTNTLLTRVHCNDRSQRIQEQGGDLTCQSLGCLCIR